MSDEQKARKNEAARAWRAANPEKIKAARANYIAANRDTVLAGKARWRLGNREKLKADGARYRQSGKRPARVLTPEQRAAQLEYIKAWRKKQRATNPVFRLRLRVSKAVNAGLAGAKSGPTFALLGYTLAELVAHLEKQFLPGMSWENRAEWHVDHIVPLDSFAAEDTLTAWALPNLRPLWAAENRRKWYHREFLL